MILKPQIRDLRIIAHFLGKIVLAYGAMMAAPIVISVLFGERVPIIDFSIGLLLSACVGFGLLKLADVPQGAEASWMHGMVVVSGGWLVCMALGAVPLYLSGHFVSYLDACFEAMSGLTTTGLSLVQDLDHLSHAANFWRHLAPFVGGQGIIVVVLSLLVKGPAGAFRLYVGEARDEKIMPNVIETAKFIWKVSLLYLAFGTAMLTAAGVWAVGMPLKESFFHGICIFMAGFDTAGFAPRSQSIIYYQSGIYEVVTLVTMIWGFFNFNLHYAVWSGKRPELWRDIETRTFLVSLTLVTAMVCVGLAQGDTYLNFSAAFRRGVYQVISGHTTTGYMTIYAPQFLTEWKPLALIGILVAMALGGYTCSTAGGIKMLRVGVIAKAFREDVKRFLTADSAVVTTKFRHLRDLFLDDKLVRSSALVIIAFLLLYFIGAVIGCYYGYPFLNSLFESTSAAATVGFSTGMTQAAMPVALKITYIVEMWAGRLEFISVLVLGGFIISFFRGK
ncbi:MAG TPA: cation transporter [Candidatus Omnitrophica bacterium]|nr:cation transporter [Candidatus Omnitrophota bacterium]